jgi:hypothetical protein
MGGRTVYGNTNSSNGWPMVDEGSCTWVTIPDTNPAVNIEIQNGQPLQILRAFVADINAYVEHVRDGDTACWTATNSVSTSNHLSGTAVDVDWELHPFQVPDAGWNGDQIATIREILDFYEGTVFWGNDWIDPKDAMHFQLASLANGGDIDTFNNPHTQDFINRKIRADGFSTFRRDNAVPPPPDPALSREDRYALLIIEEGRRRNITPKGIQIALATALVESNLTIYANERVPESMTLLHDAVGSDAYSVGIFQQQVRDTGNGWWWGDAATCMDPTSSAGLFYDRLVKLPYNTDDESPGGYAQTVQDSAFPDRYDGRFGEAVDIYNRLAGIAPPVITPPTQGGDELSAEAERMIREMYDEYKASRGSPSRSFFAKDQVWTESPLGYLWNIDGNVNEIYMFCGYLAGVAQIEADVEFIAANGVAPESWAGSQVNAAGQRWLAEVGQQWCQGLIDLRAAMQQALQNSGTPAVAAEPRTVAAPEPRVVYVDRPVPTPPTVALAQTSSSTGQVIGQAYDSLEALLASGALTDAEQGPLNALISVLQTKSKGASK